MKEVMCFAHSIRRSYFTAAKNTGSRNMPQKKAMAFIVSCYTTKLRWWRVYVATLFTQISCEFFSINTNWT
jgi:hypothetical protein